MQRGSCGCPRAVVLSTHVAVVPVVQSPLLDCNRLVDDALKAIRNLLYGVLCCTAYSRTCAQVWLTANINAPTSYADTCC
jgi:hypothetical protein